MSTKSVKYSVVDAFTDSPFKGNPAAVCLLEQDKDDQWLQSVAKEFNVSQTAFLTLIANTDSPTHEAGPNPMFRLRWFTPLAEVELCGHATLAAAHVIFSSGLLRTNIVEFSTLSGVLTAKKVLGSGESKNKSISNGNSEDDFSIELDFPVVPVVECDPSENPLIPLTLNGASVLDIKKTATTGDLIVELSSGKAVTDLLPHFDEIQKCPGRGLIITGIALSGSEFDFFSRFFCPKLGINEDPVCGSAHCALAPYWSKKLGKCDFKAYMVLSPSLTHTHARTHARTHTVCGWNIGSPFERRNPKAVHRRKGRYCYGRFSLCLVGSYNIYGISKGWNIGSPFERRNPKVVHRRKGRYCYGRFSLCLVGSNNILLSGSNVM